MPACMDACGSAAKPVRRTKACIYHHQLRSDRRDDECDTENFPELQVVEQKLEQIVEAMEVKLLERVQRRAVEQSERLFERLEEFDKRLEMSEARRAENNELIKEIGVLWE